MALVAAAKADAKAITQGVSDFTKYMTVVREKLPQWKKSVHPVERWRTRTAPIPPPGHNWGVTWPGTPDTRECSVDKEEVIRSFKTWEKFTLGTPGFWLDKIGSARRQVIDFGAAALPKDDQLTPEGVKHKRMYLALAGKRIDFDFKVSLTEKS